MTKDMTPGTSFSLMDGEMGCIMFCLIHRVNGLLAPTHNCCLTQKSLKVLLCTMERPYQPRPALHPCSLTTADSWEKTRTSPTLHSVHLQALSVDSNLSGDFVIHGVQRLCSFYSSIFQGSKLPKISHCAVIKTLPEPNIPFISASIALSWWWTHNFCRNRVVSIGAGQQVDKVKY